MLPDIRRLQHPDFYGQARRPQYTPPIGQRSRSNPRHNDGSHRLARAYFEGRDSLPAWILTAAETKAITVTAPPIGGRTAP